MILLLGNCELSDPKTSSLIFHSLLLYLCWQVAVIAPNVPAIYEAHFGVPMAGAVINPVNIRLNAQTVAFLLEHSSAAVVMVDQEFFPLAEEAFSFLLFPFLIKASNPKGASH